MNRNLNCEMKTENYHSNLLYYNPSFDTRRDVILVFFLTPELSLTFNFVIRNAQVWQLWLFSSHSYLWHSFDSETMHTRGVPKKIHHHKGQMKDFCPLISDLLLFFSWQLWLISHFRSKFSKTKGGTLGWKKSEKIDFYVWYIKRTALKNVDWKWNRFLKILILVEVMD